MEKQLEKPTVDFSTIENCFKHIEYIEQLENTEIVVARNRCKLNYRVKNQKRLGVIEYFKDNKLDAIRYALISYYYAKDRKTGRTTRLVNDYIEKLLSGEKIAPRDHWDCETSHKAIIAKIQDRLHAEHSFVGNETEESVLNINWHSKEMYLTFKEINY